MSEIVKGFIAKINGRSVNTRKGPKTSYSMKIEREDGSELDGWLSYGFNAPDVEEGAYVKVTYEKNDRGYLDITELKQLKNAPERAEKQQRSSGGGGKWGNKSGGGGSQSAFIHYQNSRTAAISLVGLMLEHDALPISAAQTKAGTAKRYDEVVALVNKLTVQLFFDLETLRLTKSVADAGAEKTKGASNDSDDDDDDGDDSDKRAADAQDDDDDE